MKVKDSRMSVLAEALEGMKLIKLQAWEKPFLQRISGIRCDELSVLRKWVSCHRFTVDRSSGTLSPPPCGKPFLFSLPSPPSLPTCSPATSSRAPPPSPPSPCSSCHRLLTPRFNILRFPLTTIPDVLLACSFSRRRSSTSRSAPSPSGASSGFCWRRRSTNRRTKTARRRGFPFPTATSVGGWGTRASWRRSEIGAVSGSPRRVTS